MNIKETIVLLLQNLKKLGFDRRAIEKELGYTEKSIDQILSKGGNEKFLNNLQRFYIEKSNKSKIDNSTKDEKIAALMAAIKIITLELVQLKSKVTGESQTAISLELERLMQLEAKRSQGE